MENIINQFLNNEGKLINDFKTIEDIEVQKKKVINTIRQTTTDNSFDILHMYYQDLKNMIANIYLKEQHIQYREYIKSKGENN